MKHRKKEQEISKRKAAAIPNQRGKNGKDIFNAFGIEMEQLNYDKIVEKEQNDTVTQFPKHESRSKRGNSRVYTESERAGQRQFEMLKKDRGIHIVINGLQKEELKTEFLKEVDIKMENATSHSV